MSNKGDKEEQSAAKKRWKLLAKSLSLPRKQKANEQCFVEDEISIRRFKGFDIFDYEKDMEDKDGIWCIVKNEQIMSSDNLKVRLLFAKIDPQTLIGFNNTGNICIWPAEELLAKYCLKNKEKFNGKRICELGGGMTALAGLLLARECKGSDFLLTDGNSESALNIQEILKENAVELLDSKVTAVQMLWGKDQNSVEKESFDYVICADCCYFLEYQQNLIDTICLLLKERGEAIMFAPKRGSTLETFINLARTVFEVRVIENYDEEIWQKHQLYKERNESYVPDIHYPLMVAMQKKKENSAKRFKYE